MLDGEANELEVRRVLKAAEKDPEMLSCFSRYRQIQDVVHRESSDFQACDISAAVSAVISGQRELPSALERAPRMSANINPLVRWVRPLRGVAVAASVAFVTVIGVNAWQQSGSPIAGGNGAGLAQLETGSSVGVSPQSSGPSSPVRVDQSGFSQLASYGRSSVDARGQVYLPQNVQLSKELAEAQRRRLVEQKRMESYLLRHTENAAVSQSSYGMMPMARVVSYDVE
jgi:sigma-E factor negative regulatory protein RseA